MSANNVARMTVRAPVPSTSSRAAADRRARSARHEALAALFGVVWLAGCGGGDIDTAATPSKADATGVRLSADASVASPAAGPTAGPTATPIAATLWLPLASEHLPFDLAAPAAVRYGLGDRWVERNLPAGPGACTNEFFGIDPSPGVVKQCELAAPDAAPPSSSSGTWVAAGDEWQGFTLVSAARVRYGADGGWIERDLAAGPVSCTNSFFGADPAPGVVKRCEVWRETSAPPPSTGAWVAAGDEWQSFTLAAAGRVRYGADGGWVERDLPAGSVSCTNSFFGSDPMPGVVKRCEVWQGASSPPPAPPPPAPQPPASTGAWVAAGNEWQSFTLASPARVRYGADGAWIERDLPAGVVSCTNSFFGADPLPGVVKHCEVWSAAGSPPSPAPQPTIASFTPMSGPVSTVVVVTGTGLVGVTSAAVGGVDAAFEIVSSSEVRVRVPSGAPSGRIVLAAGSVATVSLADFTVTQPVSVPVVTSVAPTVVAPGGQVVVTGTSLNDVASARLGTLAATIVSQTPTQLVLLLPPGAVSGALVLVDRGGVAREAAAIQVLTPMTLSGFTPAVVTRGQPLTITGQGLDRATTVRFVGADVPVTTRSGSTSITVIVPGTALGGRVTLIAEQGDEVTSGTDVVIVDPVTVATQVHRVGVGGTVTITGTGFERVRSVLLGGAEVGIASRTASSITFVVPAGVVCAGIALRLDDGAGVAAGSLITGSDCGLRAAGLELAQLLSQRTGDPRLRLAAGKETWVRAFVVASAAGTPAPQVRVQGVDMRGGLLGTLAMSGPSTLPVVPAGEAVPEAMRMNDDNTFRAELPASWIQPGLHLRVQAGESDDPSSVIETTPSIVDSGGVRVVLVPLWSGPYGPVMPGAVEAQQLVANRFPIAADRVSVTVRTPYALTSVTGGVATSAQWSAALYELEMLRANEAPHTVYYGLVQPRASAGIAGIGYVNSIGSPSPAASSLGWDASRSGWDVTMTHELGHNFSRTHAPCGGVSGSDPSYPYADGAIGPNPVFDAAANRMVGVALQYDVMGYCNGMYFSDYNLSGVKAFLEARPAAMSLMSTSPATAASPEWLVVSGTVGADGAWVRTVRAAADVADVSAAPAAATSRGGLTLRLTTRTGGVTEHAIDAVPLDHVDGEAHFTLRVASPGPLQRLEVMRDGRSIHTRESAAATTTNGRAKAGSTPAAVHAVGGGWSMAWDASHHAQASLTYVIGQSRRTLAIDAEGGHWIIPSAALQGLPAGGHLEMALSNGIDTLLLKLARP